MEFGSISYAVEGSPPQVLPLRPGVTTIGSASDNDIVLEGAGIAAFHLRLVCTPNECWVMTIDQQQPTFLNYVRLRPGTRYPLRDGDIMRVGAFFIRYTQPEAAAGDLPRLIEDIERGSLRRSSTLPPDVAARISDVGSIARRSRLPARRVTGNLRSVRTPRYLAQMSSYLQYLPPCYQDNEFLGRMLLIFESILAPLDHLIGDLPYYFDPRTAPESLLPWLATWFDLVLNENWPLERRRALILSSAELYRRRGTRSGILSYIKIYTGFAAAITEPHDPNGDDLPPHVFRVRLAVPDPAAIDRHTLEMIIESEKPAHTAYVLEIVPQS